MIKDIAMIYLSCGSLFVLFMIEFASEDIAADYRESSGVTIYILLFAVMLWPLPFVANVWRLLRGKHG